jgi:hypothetical protein
MAKLAGRGERLAAENRTGKQRFILDGRGPTSNRNARSDGVQAANPVTNLPRLSLSQFSQIPPNRSESAQVLPHILPKRNQCRDPHGQVSKLTFYNQEFLDASLDIVMRLGRSGRGLLDGNAVRGGRSTTASFTPIESARSGSLFDRLTSPLGSARSSTQTPIQTVAVPPRKSISMPGSSMFRPKVPNIHTRPKKPSKMWFPFGHK